MAIVPVEKNYYAPERECILFLWWIETISMCLLHDKVTVLTDISAFNLVDEHHKAFCTIDTVETSAGSVRLRQLYKAIWKLPNAMQRMHYTEETDFWRRWWNYVSPLKEANKNNRR